MRLVDLIDFQNNRSSAEVPFLNGIRGGKRGLPVILALNQLNHTESISEMRNRDRKVMGRSGGL